MNHRRNWSLLVLACAHSAWALGCSGGGGGPSETTGVDTTTSTSGDTTTSAGTTGDTTTGTPEVDCATAAPDVGPGVLRRLSKTEYQLTLQDLFQLTAPPAVELVPEDIVEHGFSSFAEAQSVTAGHLRAYWDTATALFDELLAAPARRDAVIGCAAGAAGCVESFVTEFGRLAYRRDLTADEVSSLVSDATSFALDAEDQLRYVAEALLVSPEFLFRVELGDSPAGLSTLSAQEVAAKLSFTLWGRGPSAALLDRADAGELDTDEGLAAVALEMLGDDKTRTYYESFFRQWLGYTHLRAPQEAPAGWSEALMPQMSAETDALVAEYAWGPGQHFFDALTANHTTVERQLATYYGVSADATGRVEFTAEDPRYNAGLLGHAALMSQKTDGDKISVRGNWLRRTFLCEELEIPPGLAEVLGEQLVGLTSTQIIAQRNEEASCKKCHSKIDPIGVGLAYFDATGRYDTEVDLAEYPIPPAFPDAEDPTFTSLAELAVKLQQMPATGECLSERVFLYAHGRPPGTEDTCSSASAAHTFAEDGGTFSSIIRSLVLDPSFRSRRAPEAL